MAFISSTARHIRIHLPHSLSSLFLHLHLPHHLPFLLEKKRWEGKGRGEDPSATDNTVGVSFFSFYQPMGVRMLLVQLYVRYGASHLATASRRGRKRRHLARRVCGWFKTSHSLRGRQKGREREKEQSELNILYHEERGLIRVLTRTNRQLRGESKDWTRVIVNEYLGINHTHNAFVYTFFLVDKLHCTAWWWVGERWVIQAKRKREDESKTLQ